MTVDIKVNISTRDLPYINWSVLLLRHGAWRQNFNTAFSKYFGSTRKDATQTNGHVEMSRFAYRLN
jgi:hypothetical protein